LSDGVIDGSAVLMVRVESISFYLWLLGVLCPCVCGVIYYY